MTKKKKNDETSEEQNLKDNDTEEIEEIKTDDFEEKRIGNEKQLRNLKSC